MATRFYLGIHDETISRRAAEDACSFPAAISVIRLRRNRFQLPQSMSFPLDAMSSIQKHPRNMLTLPFRRKSSLSIGTAKLWRQSGNFSSICSLVEFETWIKNLTMVTKWSYATPERPITPMIEAEEVAVLAAQTAPFVICL